MTKGCSRRRFLKGSVAAAGLAAMAKVSSGPFVLAQQASGDKLRVAVIGAAGMGCEGMGGVAGLESASDSRGASLRATFFSSKWRAFCLDRTIPVGPASSFAGVSFAASPPVQPLSAFFATAYKVSDAVVIEIGKCRVKAMHIEPGSIGKISSQQFEPG